MRVEALPPANEIDDPKIRQAAEKYEAARRQLHDRQTAARDLEKDCGTEKAARSRAHELDAQAADEAIAAGKPVPKRAYLAAHTKLVEDAPYELSVAQRAAQRTREELQAVLDERGPAWVESLEIRSENLEQAWNEAAAGLIRLHGERMALNALRRKLGAEIVEIGSIRLKPAQVGDSISGETFARLIPLDPYNPTAGPRRRAVIPVADALTALTQLGAADEPTAIGNSRLGEAIKLAQLQYRIVERDEPYSDEEIARAHERIAKEMPQPHVVTPGGRVASVYVPGSAGGDD